MATALITGASNGIGFELAKIHALNGGNLVFVARNKSKLNELKVTLENQYKIKVYTIGKDLSLSNSAQEVYEEIISQNNLIEEDSKKLLLDLKTIEVLKLNFWHGAGLVNGKYISLRFSTLQI